MPTSTEPFLMIPGWFESPHSPLSNQPSIIKNDSVELGIWSWPARSPGSTGATFSLRGPTTCFAGKTQKSEIDVFLPICIKKILGHWECHRWKERKIPDVSLEFQPPKTFYDPVLRFFSFPGPSTLFGGVWGTGASPAPRIGGGGRRVPGEVKNHIFSIFSKIFRSVQNG